MGRRYTVQFGTPVFPSQLEPGKPYIPWFSPLPEPQRPVTNVAATRRPPDTFTYISTASPFMAWQSQWNEPLRTRTNVTALRRPPDTFTYISSLSPLMAWQSQWNEPLRARTNVTALQRPPDTFTYISSLAVWVSSNSEPWFSALPEPWRSRTNVTALQRPPDTYIYTSTMSVPWFSALPEPLRPRTNQFTYQAGAAAGATVQPYLPPVVAWSWQPELGTPQARSVVLGYKIVGIGGGIGPSLPPSTVSSTGLAMYTVSGLTVEGLYQQPSGVVDDNFGGHVTRRTN